MLENLMLTLKKKIREIQDGKATNLGFTFGFRHKYAIQKDFRGRKTNQPHLTI